MPNIKKYTHYAAGFFAPAVGDLIALAKIKSEKTDTANKFKFTEKFVEKSTLFSLSLSIVTAFSYIAKNVNTPFFDSLKSDESLLKMLNSKATMIDGKLIDDIIIFAIANILIAILTRAALAIYMTRNAPNVKASSILNLSLFGSAIAVHGTLTAEGQATKKEDGFLDWVKAWLIQCLPKSEDECSQTHLPTTTVQKYPGSTTEI